MLGEPERILELTQAVHDVASDKIRMIKRVTGTTRILSLNALIEATRAGEVGKGFAVVANEVKQVSDHITSITRALEGELGETLDDLMALGQSMVQTLRGARLTDLSLNMIEIIDRNLYERSCDVRWWATDAAVVACLSQAGPASQAHATKRLGVILASYTVYLDLWVIDRAGRVVATGRPGRYPGAVGANVGNQGWFTQALATRDGGEYAVADIAINSHLDNAPVATYATAIRENGETDAPAIGVLVIFFDWRTQADGVVRGVRLREDEKARARCLLLDQRHRVIAASDGKGVLEEVYPLDTSQGPSGSYVGSDGTLVGYCVTPGYETYRGLGWFGVIVQAARGP